MVVWKLNCTRLKLNFVSARPHADLLQSAAEECGDVSALWSTGHITQFTLHAAFSQPSVTLQRSAPASFNTLGTTGASDGLWRVKGDQFSINICSRCHYNCIIIAKKYLFEANPPQWSQGTGQHHKQWSSWGQQLFVQYPDYPQLHPAA